MMLIDGGGQSMVGSLNTFMYLFIILHVCYAYEN